MEYSSGSTPRLQAEVMPSKSPKSRRSKKQRQEGTSLGNNPHTKQPTSEIKSESQAENMSQLLDVTIAGISAIQIVVPSDLAKGVLGTVASILMTVQSVIKNKSDFQAIVKKCKTIGEILERAMKDTTDDDLPGYLAHALSELNSLVNDINNKVVSKKKQGLFKRFLSVTIDRDQIASWEKDIDSALKLFDTEALVGIAMRMEELPGITTRVEELVSRIDGNLTSVNVLKYQPIEPPSRPSMFYGRDDLMAELTTLVVNGEHIALIGPGGMGKSSLAKAILHEPLIIEKFADRRFFVAYDDLDPSTITFETFMTHFAGALGIEITGADPLRPISTFLHSASALVVLDNAETFEEASALSALEKIPPAIAKIANIRGIILILTSRSRRNATDVLWTMIDIPRLDSSSAERVFIQTYPRARCSNAEEEIRDLLRELDYHPLSINLLAHTARQNGWSPAILLKRWNNQHSAVLNPGKGKLQSLSDTMQLSLNSPSIQDLGEDGRLTLAIIAFLPQGLNDNLAGNLLPSLQEVDKICDVLCRQSLVYCDKNFIKVLAPIRHYVQDSLSIPDSSTSLQEIRTFYYRTVEQCSEEQDGHANIIISDHFNIECVVAFDLAHIPEETYRACSKFLNCLTWHLPCPTTLTPAIFNVVEKSFTYEPKAYCLYNLAWLYSTLSQLTDAMKIYKAAEALFLATGNHEMVAECVTKCADTYRCQGRFIQSQQLLEGFQCSESWEYLSEPKKDEVWYFLDRARMCTFTASADELFVKSSDSEGHLCGLESKIWHWRAKFCYGGDIVQVTERLKNLLLQCTITEVYARCDALQGLAEVAFCESRPSEAMDILQQIIEIFKGEHSDNVLWHTALKAVVASKQGDHALARELIYKAPESSQYFELRSAFVFLHRSYTAACIELTAGAYDKAESRFITIIEGCDIQGHLDLKAYSKRGLGEIAFVHDDFALAARCFTEIRSLCTEMGVPERHLYSCEPYYVLPDRFCGWTLFLEGQSPFANNM